MSKYIRSYSRSFFALNYHYCCIEMEPACKDLDTIEGSIHHSQTRHNEMPETFGHLICHCSVNGFCFTVCITLDWSPHLLINILTVCVILGWSSHFLMNKLTTTNTSPTHSRSQATWLMYILYMRAHTDTRNIACLPALTTRQDVCHKQI